jgi:uncharacterized membrane protein YfcA
VFRVNEIRSLHRISFMMEILGYLAAVLIGISLGMIGGGGSILTVPSLVYLMGTAPVDATAYSLFIVGATALVGAWQKYRDGLVNIKAAIFFGIPSIIAVFLTRAFIMPAMPDVIGSFGRLYGLKGPVYYDGIRSPDGNCFNNYDQRFEKCCCKYSCKR